MARPTTVVAPRVAADVTINPGQVDDADVLVVTETVKGLRKGGPVLVWAEALEAGLGISNPHASDKDELTFTLFNVTGTPINPASQVFRVVQF